MIMSGIRVVRKPGQKRSAREEKSGLELHRAFRGGPVAAAGRRQTERLLLRARRRSRRDRHPGSRRAAVCTPRARICERGQAEGVLAVPPPSPPWENGGKED
jgi:hypothetical protein